MHQLSIIIVEYFCISDVIKAVESIDKNISELNYEIVVISNSLYHEDEKNHLIASLPSAKVIINTVNSGYAGGVNRALDEIDSSYVFLLNPDGLFMDNGIIKLLLMMEDRPDIAIIGPKVIDEDGNIQPSCRQFPRVFTFLLVRSVFRYLPWAKKEKQRYLMEDYDRSVPREVDWVSGGAMLLRSEAIRHVGCMDERYFLYMEDVDWCRQMCEAGLKVVYNPAAVIQHAGKHSSISGGVLGVLSKTTRWHLSSLIKYFIKWGIWNVNRGSST